MLTRSVGLGPHPTLRLDDNEAQPEAQTFNFSQLFPTILLALYVATIFKINPHGCRAVILDPLLI